MKNQTDMEGHILIKSQTTGSLPLMTLDKNVKVHNYEVLTTTKPLDSSLSDLGISLTGTTTIDVSYEKQ